MADCVVQLHCMTGCDAAQACTAKVRSRRITCDRWLISRCRESLGPEEEVVDQLFEFIRHVIYGDNKSSFMLRPVPRSGRERREIIRPYSSRSRQPMQTLPPRQLLGVSNAPLVPEAPPGGWSLSSCPLHTPCSPDVVNCSRASCRE